MPINGISFRGSNNFQTAKTAESKSQTKQTETKSKLAKAAPYAAGVLIIGASVYAMRGKIAKLFKNVSKEVKIQESPINPEQKQQINQTPNLPAVIYRPSFLDKKPIYPKFEVTPELRAQIRGESPFRFNIPPIETKAPKQPYIKPEVSIQEIKPEYKTICTGFDKEGKAIYESVEMPSELPIARNGYREAIQSIDLHNPSTVSKIEKNRKSEQKNITRILNENTHNGQVDMPMMRKIAGDYMLDANRGEDRFHQAADLLEQAHIKQHLRGNIQERSGMYNLVDGMTTDPVLYKCYQNMPMEESAARLNYLKENDLKSTMFKEGMNAEGFFEKTFTKLVDKYQMKRYNEAHGIQG